MAFSLELICDLEDEFFGFFPAEAGVGDRLSVDVLAYFLRAVLDIAFDHETLDELLDLGTVAHTMEYLLCDTYLFKVLLS